MKNNSYEKKYVIITAGGSGTRMHSRVAKQFLEIDGMPILLHTLKLFLSLPFYVEIILVLPKDQIPYWDRYCAHSHVDVRWKIVEGGLTRFHSVRNGLNAISGSGIVAVHDGVRPFADKKMIESLFDHNLSDSCAGVIPVMPAVESMRMYEKDDLGNITGTRTVDRSNYLFVQTPQVFNLEALKKAYSQPYLPQFTDDASVLEEAGYTVDTVPGNRLNIKITVPEDLELAELIYSSLQNCNL